MVINSFTQSFLGIFLGRGVIVRGFFLIFVVNMYNYTFYRQLARWVMAAALLLTAHCPACAFTVVLDAGHGGKDYGAIGKKTNEKSINLAVVKLVADFLDKNYSDIVVLKTRDDDTYLTLRERADFANKNSGDLFVSVHVNSVDTRNRNRANIQGASVYTLGLHKSEANFEVAKRENSVISLENDFTTNYEGFDPESSESYIIFEMSQSKNMVQSVNLAQQIQNELTTTAGRADRGVLQAGFWVLWATGMPSVLVELDFICNPTQEAFLSSGEGQKKMATAIGTAIGDYAVTHADVEAPGVITPFEISEKEKPATVQETKPAPSTTPKKEKKDKNTITFHIQILASAKAINKKSPEFKGYKPSEVRDGKWHKYYVGNYATLAEAKTQLVNIKKKFPGAYIVKMRQGKIIE